MQLSTIDVFSSGEEWAKQRRPAVVEMIDKRLSRLSAALSEKPYLDGDGFTAGDLMMASVLRSLEGKNMLERYPNLVAYLARCLGRQGFRDALAAQMADFEQRDAGH
jgi:glutathione S-transferase